MNISAPIYATDSAVEKELIPSGNHVARCISMIHIGTVQGTFGVANKIRIGWELPEELRVFDKTRGEQPMMISQEYTLSMNPKANLRKMLASWRGKDFTAEEAKKFNISVLVGVPCLLNVIHAPGQIDPTKTVQKISSVSTLPKNMKAPKAINPITVLTYGSWDQTIFDSLPEYLRNTIVTSKEYQAMKHPETTSIETETEETESDLPF